MGTRRSLAPYPKPNKGRAFEQALREMTHEERYIAIVHGVRYVREAYDLARARAKMRASAKKPA
jgi:hypothetical protein